MVNIYIQILCLLQQWGYFKQSLSVFSPDIQLSGNLHIVACYSWLQTEFHLCAQ
jgi:hypothetical protein